MKNDRNNSRVSANRFGWLLIIITVIAVVILAAILIIYLRSGSSKKNETGMNKPGVTGVRNENPLSALPDMPDKPKPYAEAFNGCPPEGDAGDPQLNRLKNRQDEGNYIPVEFDAIMKLNWPHAIERRNRAKWARQDAEAVARYEGIPVSVQGYLAGVKQEGPESCNCHGADSEMRDYHVWLTKGAGEDRSNSIVVEVSPVLKSKHPSWDIKNLRKIVKNQQKVRISGWLMMDPEHPDQVGRTRGTIWEIHPIMLIEVEQNGKWISIDKQALAFKGGKDA